jgi:hypothetical protein
MDIMTKLNQGTTVKRRDMRCPKIIAPLPILFVNLSGYKNKP